jgi:ribosomal biogenesis protein LAS1
MSLLARQIGLPPGLIGLRHEATHEDLPSLPVLREAVWKALEYLRVESLEPLVFSGIEIPSSSRSKDARRRLGTQLDTLFRKHKRMMKGYFRERTSKSSGSGGKELRVLMREIEDLVDKVLGEEGGEDERESMGLDVITDCLLKPGCLVPLSIR